jgi:DNA-binding NtrC family response regulator
MNDKSLVLIIDDENSILMLLKEVLQIHDFKVITFQNFFKAKEFYKKNVDAVKLIILDMQLFETDYNFTLPALFEINSSAKIIAMSGAINIDEIPLESREKIQCLLRKPFSIESLLTEIKRID